ncbi:21716_t:CDS:1, partial [Gigaspora rosea]
KLRNSIMSNNNTPLYRTEDGWKYNRECQCNQCLEITNSPQTQNAQPIHI